MNLIWSPGTTLAEVEKQVILTAFEFYRKVKTSTASALGISVRTLDTKLELYEQEGVANETRRREHEVVRANERRRHLGQPGHPIEPTVFAEPGTGPRVAGNHIIPAEQPLPKKPGLQASAGVRVESGQGPAAERSLSVQQREEIQKVLPTKIAASGAGGRR